MFRFLWLEDTHIMGVSPDSRKDNIKDVLYDKLKQVGVIANDKNVDIVVHGGDMFDTPDVSNKLFSSVSEIIRSWNKPVYVVPGNHDIYGYDVNTLPNTKLGALASTGVVTILDRAHPIMTRSGNISISIEGQEYYADIDSGVNNDYEVYSTANIRILAAHSMLMDHDFISDVKYTNIDKVKTNADLVLTGHYHPGFNFKEVDGTMFANIGALLRRENTKDNMTRIPSVLIVEINDNGEFNFEVVPLKVGAYKDVFKDTTAAKEYDNTIKKFDNKIANHSFKGINIVDMIKDYSNNNPDDVDVCEDILNSVTQAQIKNTVDKGYIPTADKVYIESLELTNFQGHKSLNVPFVNGLNIIEGPTNAGKTAILRAISWVLYDTPSGSDFITTGEKSCSVKLNLSNKCTIERKRTRSSAGEYILTDKDGNSQVYKGFSKKVPIEIFNTHQMPEVEINKTKYRLNIADQLDGLFMINSTSNDKLALIGTLVDTDILDTLRAKYNADKIKYSSDKKRYDQNLDLKLQELSKYDNLDNINNKVSKIEAIVEQIEAVDENINNYISLKDEHDKLLNMDRQLENKLNSYNIPDIADIKALSELIDDIDKFQSVHLGYNKHIEEKANLETLEKEINSKVIDKTVLDEFGCKLNEIEELITLRDKHTVLINENFDFDYDLDALKVLTEELNSIISEVEELSSLNDKYKEVSSKNFDDGLLSLQNSINSFIKIKEKKIAELKAEEAVCPYCKQKIDMDIALQE